MFQDEIDVLKWYQSKPRVLSKDFLNKIPWKDTMKYKLDPKFIPVLVYMRDVEKFTAVYYEELRRTPTAKDPLIRQFMDQWEDEEALHGDLLDRFLNEADFQTSKNWEQEALAKIPKSYTIQSRISTLVTNFFGESFSAVHMTWGAINEYSTMYGYQKLWELAKHPVLEHLLRGIVQEEGRHSLFYWHMANIRLKKSNFRQKLARAVVDNFWAPVGSGAKTESDANQVIKTLFAGNAGVDYMNRLVNSKISELPGFNGFTKVTNRIAETALA